MSPAPLSFAERRRLLLQQMRLECIAVDDQGVMTPFPCPNPDRPPRVLRSTLGDRTCLFVRHDLPAPRRAALIASDPATLDDASVIAILGAGAAEPAIWHNRATILPAGDFAGRSPDVERLPGSATGTTAFGIVVDGEVAAACSAVREDDRSAEAWVFTEERYRRRGYASQVVAAWASDLHRQGKTPFYSYLLENTASHALAVSLGAIPFAESTGFV